MIAHNRAGLATSHVSSWVEGACRNDLEVPHCASVEALAHVGGLEAHASSSVHYLLAARCELRLIAARRHERPRSARRTHRGCWELRGDGWMLGRRDMLVAKARGSCRRRRVARWYEHASGSSCYWKRSSGCCSESIALLTMELEVKLGQGRPALGKHTVPPLILILTHLISTHKHRIR